ncbi:MAG: 2-oxo acid dehydrogenase subunit E2 [Methylotenera sp.]|nr:2-oxo acid dehydrogenase subunit E2 [Oligoflexia bacterium]
MHLKLPELGEGVHEGELIQWKVKVGDVIKEDQSLCEIMTDKATVELPSNFHGTVTEILAKVGETVKVGQAMLSYDSGAGAATSASAPAKAPEKSGEAKAPAPAAQAPGPASNTSGSSSLPAGGMSQGIGGNVMSAATNSNVMAAPSTRKLAREMGVELSQVQGSGPQGRIMREDLSGATQQSTGTGATRAGAPQMARRAPGAQIEERVPFRGLRKKISEKMRQSMDHAVHFTYVEEADATALVELRNQAKELGAKVGVKVTYLPFIMKAMVAALKKYPVLNTSLDEEKGELIYKHYYNIALSVQTEDGLTAPVIKDVNHKSVLELAKEIQDVVDRARNKKLTMDDLTGSTITLTNAGSIGGLFATPVINYPEVAIVGFNKIFRKPVAIMKNGKEEIAIRDWTYFSISLDHRVVDGAIGAEYMKTLIQYVENPALLLMDA